MARGALSTVNIGTFNHGARTKRGLQGYINYRLENEEEERMKEQSDVLDID